VCKTGVADAVFFSFNSFKNTELLSVWIFVIPSLLPPPPPNTHTHTLTTTHHIENNIFYYNTLYHQYCFDMAFCLQNPSRAANHHIHRSCGYRVWLSKMGTFCAFRSNNRSEIMVVRRPGGHIPYINPLPLALMPT